eukprot:TRINITY_DN11850_c0_g1_i1.p1 TRINITY_DN11850_c0_g1~~TRINITY_DN11850_c0_g1_i1.p1  ORF type:complete len:218 (+),score=58.61 TRINITY_DN11850_c0_g1_i1:56-709(+)
MTKLNQEEFMSTIEELLKYSNEEKKRNFVETIEIQVGLKNYDPVREKRFQGTFVLPHPIRNTTKMMIIGNERHCDDAKEKGFDYIDVEGLKEFKRKMKPIKKWAKPYHVFVASDTLIRQVPRILGPYLNKVGKFPSPLGSDEDITSKYEEMTKTMKWQMKKVICINSAVANVTLSAEEIHTNSVVAINGLVSLLKKGWQNIRSLHIKSTMGPAFRIY